MPKLIQTTTTETETTWKGLANLIKGGGGTLKIGDIITEKTLDGEEMDLVVVDMGPDWARFESKDCLPVEVAYNQNNRKGGSPDWYWTASVGSGNSTSCVRVNYNGSSNNWYASNELYVPVCFVIQ